MMERSRDMLSAASVPSRWRDLLNLRAVCCAHAVRLEAADPRNIPCVCAHREWCPEHGLTHVGTHD
jgi:hypothetical protein